MDEMNCPICNTEMEHRDDCMEMEDEHICKGCGRYGQEYIAGHHEIGIKINNNWQVWEWSYTTPAEEVKAIKAEIEAAVAVAKRECAEQEAIDDYRRN